MLDMLRNSVTLFFRGKLFKNGSHVFRQVLFGALFTALVCILLAKVGIALWLAVTVSAVLGGALQPWLFKDLKYA